MADMNTPAHLTDDEIHELVEDCRLPAKHSVRGSQRAYYYTDDPNSDHEIEWCLEYDVTPYRPETRWEPAEGGIIAVDMWRGDTRVDFMDHQHMYDRLMWAAADNEQRRADGIDAWRDEKDDL